MTEPQLTALGLTLNDWNSFGPFEKLFLDVSQVLSGIADFRWIDLEAGQLELPLESYPVQFPCALIDFPDSQYQDEGFGNQQGIIMVQLRIGIDLYEDLHMIDSTSAPDKGTAIKRLKLITVVHTKLHGYETDYSTPLVRASIQVERRDDGIKVFAIVYGCAAKDHSAAKVFNQFTGADLEVNKV